MRCKYYDKIKDACKYDGDCIYGDYDTPKYDTLKAKAELADRMEFILAQIIHDLPINRDWLDPTVELEAKVLLAKAEDLK
jgi:hypothetical protein